MNEKKHQLAKVWLPKYVEEIRAPALPLFSKVAEFEGEKYLTNDIHIYKPTGKTKEMNGVKLYEYRYCETIGDSNAKTT